MKGSAEDAEVAGMSSPLDGGLDFAKKKRINQMQHKQKEEQTLEMGACDLGASPVMARGLKSSGK